jgi:glycosyltransferase involved in cell wall biosynthesis
LKLLFVTPYLPSPPTFGGAMRLHGLMRDLSREHEVSVVSLVDPREDTSEKARATAVYCRRVTTVPNRRQGSSRGLKRLLQFGSMLSPNSYEQVAYYERAMQGAVDRALARESYDVVQFECSQMAVYAKPGAQHGVKNGPIYCLDEHNVEYDVVRRTAEAEVGPFRRAYSAVNWRKLKREERAAWRAFEGSVLTSARDETMLREDEPGARTAVVPNGVDVDAFSRGDWAREPNQVLFFGALNYYPNIDALQFFLREVWPLVLRERASARLRIIGHKPPPWLASWADPTVEMVGFVDDVRPHIARASVVLAPLRIGGGTRLKVLEAMSLATAVVSTSLGAEGLDVQAGENILLADDARSFAGAVVRILGDASFGERLGVAARKLVVERYSWHASTQRLLAFYEELYAGRRQASSRGMGAPTSR